MGPPRVQRDPAAAPRSPEVPGGQEGHDRTGYGPGGHPCPPRADGPSDGVPVADGDAVGAPASKRVLRSQGRRTMRKLLDAAMVAFDNRGYHATRVNDVVEIAKTSHGTFYLYFSNKEDLLRALVAEAAGEAQTLYDALSTLPGRGRRTPVGGRARMDLRLLRALDPLRAPVPGLDRPGHHRLRNWST